MSVGAILGLVVTLGLALFAAYLNGRNASARKAAEKSTEAYQDADKIKAQPNLPNTGDKSVWSWFRRLHK